MAEVRKLGANDLQIGEGTVVSPGGKTVQEIDARHIPVAYGTANDAVTNYSNVVFSVEDALNTSLDLRAYLPSGFVSDGSIDYATQIQTAITAAMSAKKPLIIPKGIWAFSSTLTITGPLYMTGVGKDSTQTQLKYTGTTGTAIKISLTPESASFIENVTLKDFYLRVTANTTIGIHVYMGNYVELSDIQIIGNDNASAADRYGLKIEGGVNNSFSRLNIWGQGFGGATASQYLAYGVYVGNGYGNSPSTTQSFYDCIFHYCTTASHINDDSQGIEFFRCIFEACTAGYGALIDNANVSFFGCWFELVGTSTLAPVYMDIGNTPYFPNTVNFVGCMFNIYTLSKVIEAAGSPQINLFGNKFQGSNSFTVLTAGGNTVSINAIGNVYRAVTGTVSFLDGGGWDYKTFRRDQGSYYKTYVSATPEYIGEEALVSGEWYKAVALVASGDWKKITP